MDDRALLNIIEGVDPLTRFGRVSQIIGLVVESLGPPEVALGEICLLGDPGQESMQAEVVGFKGKRVLLMPLGEIEGIRPGTMVSSTRGPLYIPVGESLQGRILDGLGCPLDGKGEIHALERRSVQIARRLF